MNKEDIRSNPEACPSCGSTEHTSKEPFIDTTRIHEGTIVECFTCAQCRTFWITVYDCKIRKKYEIS